MTRLDKAKAKLEQQLVDAAAAVDHAKLTALGIELTAITPQHDAAEEPWPEPSDKPARA